MERLVLAKVLVQSEAFEQVIVTYVKQHESSEEDKRPVKPTDTYIEAL